MKLTKETLLRDAWIFARIAIGAAIYAAGFQFFTYPNGIIAGGVTGIAMIINYLTQLPVGVMIIIMNIPLFIFAWKRFGNSYFICSLIGMLLSSVLMDLFAMIQIDITSEPLLASIYGGVIKGFGCGLIYAAGGSSGGIDIGVKMLRVKYPYINFGTLMLLLDATVVVAFAVIFSKYDSAMYAVIAMFATSKLIDLVLYGSDSSKVCHIITDHSDDIRRAITERLGRGVTLLYGRGAYSGQDKQIILCVIKRSQVADIKKIAQEYDERAFIIMSDSHEVYGKGFGNIGDLK